MCIREEHSVIGGLGEAVCGLLSKKLLTPCRRIGVGDEFGHSGPAVPPCVFENGEPFVRKTYLICQKEALALPQVNAFVELLKEYR